MTDFQPGLYPCLVISNLDFDKRRKEKEKEEEEEEKKFGNSKPRHFPKEMAEAKREITLWPLCFACSVQRQRTHYPRTIMHSIYY